MIVGSVTEKTGNRDVFGRYGKSREAVTRKGLPKKRRWRWQGARLLVKLCKETRAMVAARSNQKQKDPDTRQQTRENMGHRRIFVLKSSVQGP